MEEKIMRIECVKGGFIQYYENNIIEKITATGQTIQDGTRTVNFQGETFEVSNSKFIGTCTIHFHNKPPKEFDNIDFCTAYNSQYGIPVSEDGSKLFVGSWEWEKGLQAYDTEMGELLWRIRQGKSRNVFVYSDYIIVLKDLKYIYKVDIASGKILGEIKCYDGTELLDLGAPYIAINRPVGNLTIVDTNQMTVIKKYGGKILNPSKHLSLYIDEVSIKDNKLIISGSEPAGDGSLRHFKDKVIDEALFEDSTIAIPPPRNNVEQVSNKAASQ